MTEPEEQLRRLADGRARMVEPFSVEEIDRAIADVHEMSPRRWPTAVAASLLAIAAVGAVVVAYLVGPDGRDADEFADGEVPVVDGESGDGAPGEDAEASASSATSTTVGPQVSIPDVVGDDVDAASAAMRAAGLDVELGALFVKGDDDRLGEVVEVTTDGGRIEMVVARLAPSLLSTDPCQRPAYLLGNFDDDLLVDRVYPRFTDGRLTEVEICTGAGVRAVASELDLHRIELAADLDGDGVDELLVSVEPGGPATRVLSIDGGEIVEAPVGDDFGLVVAELDPLPECLVNELDVALLGDVDGDGLADLVAPRDNIVCLGSGPVVPLGEAAAEAGTWFLDDIDDDGVLEVFIGQTTHDAIRVRPYSIGADGSVAPLLDDDCCVQTTLESAVLARTDTDTAAVAEPVAGRWFSCVAAVDGRPAGLVAGRFWIDLDAGTVEWVVDGPGPDPETQTEPDADTDAETGTDGASEPGTDGASEPGTDADTGSGVGTGIDVETGLDVETKPESEADSRSEAGVVHTMVFDDPLATDAWIPGNGCRNSAGPWVPPVSLDFADDGHATEASVAAFNESIAFDDPDRRLVRLREAIGIAAQMVDAAGPYREHLDEGYFEIGGLADESVQATRWNYAFSDDGTTLESVTRSWACQPGRGHDDFSAEVCS